MDSKKIYKQFEKIGLYWLHSLDNYNDEPFLDKPDEKEWSLGQLYEHLSNGTIEYHLKMLHDAIDQKGGVLKGKKKFKGKVLFWFGAIPNKKIKSPKHESHPPRQPESVKDAKNSMIKLLKAMNDTSKLIPKANLDYKTEHRLFGYLNAMEWYKLIEFHFKHHLKQKKRLDKRLIR